MGKSALSDDGSGPFILVLAPQLSMSHRLLKVEVAVILVPYTVALVVGTALLAADLVVNRGQGLPAYYFLTAIALFFPISCLWSLARAFRAGGSAALHHQPRWRKWGAASIILLGGVQLFSLVDRLSSYPDDPSPFAPFPVLSVALAGGWPLYLVAAHFFYEMSQPEGL